ncbi:T6SS immunity protein Tli4 family protein [Xanthomonas translucens]|uniref:T6SS immunity protein Tli4 family protein n=1 Tax=Xanthomonas campestris pv. translucens TaxID=343 RepID=UPI000B0F879D|nr:T6SS immunity protein Tli4 family protein [Xanthomonas translucens]QEN94403.1 hypothetical protein F0H33_14320 [Xanthomonas translucens pv. undulosa]
MKRSIFGLVSLLFLAACQSEVAPVDPSQNKIPLAPHCIGRTTIDLPVGAILNWSQEVEIFAVDRDGSSSREKFEEEIEARKSQLKAMPHDTEGSRLSDFQKIRDGLALIIFRDSEVSTYIYKVEAYYWPGPWGYKLSGEVASESRAELQSLPALADNIKVFQGPDSSEDHGFCIDGGYIEGAPTRLSVNVTGRIRNWQSSSFWVGAFEGENGPEDEAAEIDHELKREKDAAKDVSLADPEATKDPAFPKSFVALRHGDRALAGLSGKELVWRKELSGGSVAYRFRWQAKTGLDSGVAVGLDIGDETGTRSAPSEHDMFALWDAMLPSLSVKRKTR